MNVTQENMQYIINVVNTARLINIENIIIEPGLVRAIDESSTVVLHQDTNVPDMEFGSIGLTRTNVLTARYNIVKDQDNFKITASVNDGDLYARSLNLTAGNTKVDYRCANPTQIKAPKQLNETMKYEIDINEDTVDMLQRGVAAMGTDIVSIISNKDVSFELIDVNNDVFKHTFAEEVICLTEDTDTRFAYRYPVKILLSLFKKYPSTKIQIGSKGILLAPIENVNVYILPQV
jgi:hypothetical protein